MIKSKLGEFAPYFEKQTGSVDFIVDSKEVAVATLVKQIAGVIIAQQQANQAAHLSILGGSTVNLVFDELAKAYPELSYEHVHFWWNDERLVPASSSDSNYGQFKRRYLETGLIKMPEQNVHFMRGEVADQTDKYGAIEAECQRLARETLELLPNQVDGVPSYDLVVLGLGGDSHTASLFPGVFNYHDETLYVPTVHPVNHIERISQTARLINAAKEIAFIAFGADKYEAVTRQYAARVVNRSYQLQLAGQASDLETAFARFAQMGLDNVVELAKEYLTLEDYAAFLASYATTMVGLNTKVSFYTSKDTITK